MTCSTCDYRHLNGNYLQCCRYPPSTTKIVRQYFYDDKWNNEGTGILEDLRFDNDTIKNPNWHWWEIIVHNYPIVDAKNWCGEYFNAYRSK